MNFTRMFHSCQLLTHDNFLVYGGLAHVGEPGIQQDELYNIASEETAKLLDHESSLNKYQHATSRLGNQVYVFGSTNIATNKIAVFDNKTNSWNDLNQALRLLQELHSYNTSELVVTPFPVLVSTSEIPVTVYLSFQCRDFRDFGLNCLYWVFRWIFIPWNLEARIPPLSRACLTVRFTEVRIELGLRAV